MHQKQCHVRQWDSQAEDAVTRSGPLVAERVGIALRDVVNGKSPMSVSIGEGSDDGGVLNSGNRPETTVLVVIPVSVFVTVVTSSCLFTTSSSSSLAD